MSDKEDKNTWPKKITVDKRIVSILSEQTYDNFPNAIKEIITNSYDADATRVAITLDLSKERVEIFDNGSGMSETEFNFYLRIAGKSRQKSARTPSGRYIIGQFGVGFLSVFPFFKTLSIRTKKRNSNVVTFANIPCYQYFTEKNLDITDINISGGTRLENGRYSESYTEISLSGFTDVCRNFFYATPQAKPRRVSIVNLDSVQRFRWKLEEDLPLEYEDLTYSSFSSIYSPNLPFHVTFNNNPLQRRVFGNQLLEKSDEVLSIGKIRFQYFIATSRKSVTPNEARFLKIRNLNAGVGERTNFGLGTERGGARSRLHWLTGEIHVIDGLNEIINVQRTGFNYSPDMDDFKDFFIAKLSYFSDQLEREAEVMKFIDQSKDETTIKDLQFLNPTVIARKVEEVRKYSDDAITERLTESFPAKVTHPVLPKIDPPERFEKRLAIHNSKYTLKLEKWDYQNSEFPAVQIDGDELKINSNYPLFAGKKYTDVFLKMHLLMAQYLHESRIDDDIYQSFTHDVLNLFNDYIK